jgi:hypothetical protein
VVERYNFQAVRNETMNIEQTMEFILAAQARAEARAEKHDERMRAQDLRTRAMETRLDKRMDAITRILQQGMRMLTKTQSRVDELAAHQKELSTSLKELAVAQQETQRTLKQLIASIVRGRNGQ